MENSILNKSVNEFTKKYFLKNNGFSDRDLLASINTDTLSIKKQIAELLLCYDVQESCIGIL